MNDKSKTLLGEMRGFYCRRECLDSRRCFANVVMRGLLLAPTYVSIYSFKSEPRCVGTSSCL
jgi:hypothetical protein